MKPSYLGIGVLALLFIVALWAAGAGALMLALDYLGWSVSYGDAFFATGWITVFRWLTSSSVRVQSKGK